MMMMRRFITSLLIVVLVLSGATRAFASPRDEDLTTTPDEAREARELLEEFNQKFVETNDIAPLIKDYFVPDFPARLGKHAETFPFKIIEWKDDAAPPDPEDLRRFYVASTNFLHAFFPLYAAAAKKCAEDEDREDGEKDHTKGGGECDGSYDPKPEKFLPPAAVEIMKADPLMREMWFGSSDESDTALKEADAQATPQAASAAEGACVEGCAASAGHKDRMVENAAELRRLTESFDDLSKALREHLAAHPVSFEQEPTDDDKESKAAEFQRFDPKKIEIFDHARVLDKDFYGYPEGTRIVCGNVGALHAELVRVDGKLRILTVYLLMED
jgi:hypothetical protein